MKIPSISIEQWAIFKTVIDSGSFAQAAIELNKSQSAISYAIAKLEQSSPAPLLQKDGRRSSLTDAGQVMYRHASNLLAHAQKVEDHALYLASGWQSEVTIAVDAVVGMQAIICGLRAFSIEHPATRVRILETSLSSSDDALLERQADIVYGPRVPPGFLSSTVGTFEMPCVVSPDHVLAQLDRAVTSDELQDHRQIVLRDSGTKRNQDAGWLKADQRWTVSYFGTTIQIVKQGLGFAFIPISHIKHELEHGLLKEVSLSMSSRRSATIYRIFSAQEQANPAVQSIASFIDAQLMSN
ncbi:LysR family transcriptional regulator [Alginatibacterium sediminis]|uniref:LysR family transcriptional regulator n=1 Tax=Alginatibacterium sediminis TaxID=2164068 RepID=A0A420ENB5_9ALTE|nr:LysR family transcriptional regulator [Alginatibacterium sediminis]RKF22225.1 LysR family transcriptional regulator [Alginatibacterium sediminis]